MFGHKRRSYLRRAQKALDAIPTYDDLLAETRVIEGIASLTYYIEEGNKYFGEVSL